MNDPPEESRRFPQFSLMSLVGGVTTICVMAGICVWMGLEVTSSLLGLAVIVGGAIATIAIIEGTGASRP